MYKIKIFRNMSGIVAGQSMKSLLSNKDWWKGMFSNMVSTMLGIALTVGVAAFVEYRNDRKLSREMMFQVISTCEDDLDAIERYDSIYNVHFTAVDSLTHLYYVNDYDISKAPVDSVLKYATMLFQYKGDSNNRTNVDAYFFNAQMMHQFGNAKKYSIFAQFVKEDQAVYEKLDVLYKQWYSLISTFYELGIDDPIMKNNIDVLQELIKDHKLTSYKMNIIGADLGREVALYKYYFKILLKVSGATKEEYEEYKKSTDLDNEIKDIHYEYSSERGGMKSSSSDDN